MFHLNTSRGFSFPFSIRAGGLSRSASLNEEIHGKIIQVLFTARGERVNEPEFGCGLLNLVFDPNDDILAAATQFTIGQALTRWLGDEIVVDGIEVRAEQENTIIEVSYTQRRNLVSSALGIQFTSTLSAPALAPSSPGPLNFNTE